jgi:hypothetical protein
MKEAMSSNISLINFMFKLAHNSIPPYLWIYCLVLPIHPITLMAVKVAVPPFVRP